MSLGPQPFGQAFPHEGEPKQSPTAAQSQPQPSQEQQAASVRRALGEHLVLGGFLTTRQLQAALQDQFCDVNPTAKRLGEILVSYGWVSGKVIDFFLRYRSHHLIQPGKQLGDYLLDLGIISREDLDKALRLQKTSYRGHPLGQILVKFGLVKKQTIDYLVESIIKLELLRLSQKWKGQDSNHDLPQVNASPQVDEEIYYDELTPFSEAFSPFKKNH
ncbi:hypothetical protein VZG28_09715 [Synechococcus elongatus IITB4]|uniref:hypothetical protein n=1 Tax=Synechococcus elongatus TaxID=32046 RepID=UPI0030CBF2B5